MNQLGSFVVGSIRLKFCYNQIMWQGVRSFEFCTKETRKMKFVSTGNIQCGADTWWPNHLLVSIQTKSLGFGRVIVGLLDNASYASLNAALRSSDR